MKEERILAIDYGTKRIGLAITDPLKIFAIPFDTLPNDNSTIPAIIKVINEKNVNQIILGYPVKESGEESSISWLIIKFKKELESKSGIEIQLVDERYSSDIASQKILESVKSKKKRRDKSLLDKSAAAVILEEYLNSL